MLRWGQTLRFLTFAENELLINTVIDSALNNLTIDLDFLNEKLDDLTRTSTIQGAIKEDYLASELMSRIQ